MSRLHSRHVVSYVESGLARGADCFWIVMEMLPGGSLDLQVNRGALPEIDVIKIGIDLCAALKDLHALGILHRDVKPANIVRQAKRRQSVLSTQTFSSDPFEEAVLKASTSNVPDGNADGWILELFDEVIKAGISISSAKVSQPSSTDSRARNSAPGTTGSQGAFAPAGPGIVEGDESGADAISESASAKRLRKSTLTQLAHLIVNKIVASRRSSISSRAIEFPAFVKWADGIGADESLAEITFRKINTDGSGRVNLKQWSMACRVWLRPNKLEANMTAGGSMAGTQMRSAEVTASWKAGVRSALWSREADSTAEGAQESSEREAGSPVPGSPLSVGSKSATRPAWASRFVQSFRNLSGIQESSSHAGRAGSGNQEAKNGSARNAGKKAHRVRTERLKAVDGVVCKLVDFGSAVAAREISEDLVDETLMTVNADEFAGTPAYAPPEAFLDPASISFASDLWSVAASLFHLASGRLPFPCTTPLEASLAIAADLEQAPPDVRDASPDELRASISGAFAEAVKKGLQKKRENRCA